MNELKKPLEDDADDFDVMMNGPAVDRAMIDLGDSYSLFSRYPSPSAMTQLAAAGILVRGRDLLALQTALRTFLELPNAFYSPKVVERQREIARLSTRLRDLLAEDDSTFGDSRMYWGDIDWEALEHRGEEPEPQWTIDVSEMRQELHYLGASASESAEWLDSARDAPIEPGSNRAPRLRFFYWLMLLAFWRHQLGRDIATSTNDDGAYGPLVTFIRVMSARSMTDEDLKGTTIRSFVRQHSDRSEQFAGYFHAWRLEKNTTP